MVFGSCRSHRRGPTVRIQTLRRRSGTAAIFGNRITAIFRGDRARWLALRKRAATGTLLGPMPAPRLAARCPRAAGQGPTLARRCNSEGAGLLRMVIRSLAPRAADFVLRRHRQFVEGRHPRRAKRHALGGRRNERRRRRGLVQLHRLVMIREQRGFGRDRADADIAIRRRLERRPIGRDRRHGFGDRGKSSAIDLLGTHRRGRWCRTRHFLLVRALTAERWLSARKRAVNSARRLSGAPDTVASEGGLTRAPTLWSMPVATTETRMTPSSASSKVAPTMMIGVVVDLLANPGGGFIHFEQRSNPCRR